MLGNLIGGFIVILVGTTLIPSVADNIALAKSDPAGSTNTANITGASATILDLVTIFFALGVMSAGVSLAISGLRNAGLV